MYKGKKAIKGQILGCLQQAETTDLHEQNRITVQRRYWKEKETKDDKEE